MIPNGDAVLLFKFGEQRWMERLVAGEVSFSCPGNFVYQAKRTGNDVQGDIYDGIFARLEPDDPRIESMKNELGNDLEQIEDGDYIILRRRSAKLKPIFCMYSYTAGDILIDGSVDSSGYHNVRHDFDEKMYSGFSNSLEFRNVISEPYRFTQLTIQPKPFIEQFKKAMRYYGINYVMKQVNYELFEQNTFFIQPTERYDELFYKFPEYRYQYEARICLVDMKFTNIFQRKNIKMGALDPNDYRVTHTPLYLNSGIIAQGSEKQ